MPVPIRTSVYWPYVPHTKQAAFLALPHREALYGGAAGGGKSDALLMAALQYVDVPGYSAILFRRTFPDLKRADGLIPRSKEWLSGTAASWNDNDHRWTFPSGATIEFAQLQHEDDKLKYQGAAYHFVGFDELTQFTETQYTYVGFSRSRRTMKQRAAGIPIRVRAASNPGGPGHEWVRNRFGLYRPESDPKDTPMMCHRPGWASGIFIPARLTDNPALDSDEYTQGLQELDLHTRRQLLEGDWDSRPPGDLFRRDWFEIVDTIPEGCKWVRFWDLAATEPSDSNPDPDWTVGLRLGAHPNGTFYVEHVQRLRSRPKGVETAVEAMTERDGRGTGVRIEQEPGSSGVNTVDAYQRLLKGRDVRGVRSTGSKAERARVVSAKAEHGLVKLLRGTWNAALLDELEAFTETDDHAHDDQVDGLSGAYQALIGAPVVKRQSYMDAGQAPKVRRGDLLLEGDQYIDLP